MLKKLLISGIILLCLDAAFLYANKTAFENTVVDIQRVILQVKPIGAFFCYLLLILGLYYFIIAKRRSPVEAFLFGLVVFGVFETTCYAIFKKWKAHLAIMDTLWGGVLMSVTTYLTYTLSSL